MQDDCRNFGRDVRLWMVVSPEAAKRYGVGQGIPISPRRRLKARQRLAVVAPVEIDVRLQNSDDGFDRTVRRGACSRDVVLDNLRDPCVRELLKNEHAKAVNGCHTSVRLSAAEVMRRRRDRPPIRLSAAGA